MTLQKLKIENMLVLYNNNKEFAEYVDKYAQHYRITVSTALTHEIVKEYARYICLRD